MPELSPDDEQDPFLESAQESRKDSDERLSRHDELTREQAWCLYLSHFLSMWNSRTYEYSVILFIQTAFPGNLMASSINGIADTVCVLLFSSSLGRWIDNAPSRLRPLLLTIAINRISVVVCCILWLVLLAIQNGALRYTVFVILLLLGMVEKVSRMTNTLSMERDWVPMLANVPASGKNENGPVPYGLTALNTAMRRIDIICKFIAPLAISAFIATVSPLPATGVLAGFSIVSLGCEYYSALRVWRQNRRLQKPKSTNFVGKDELVVTITKPDGMSAPLTGSGRPSSLSEAVQGIVYEHVEGIRYYFSTAVSVPSMCIAVLHASVLSWSGTLITYLLNAGFPLGQVTVVKGIGSIFEIGSTIIFPWAVRMLLRSSRAVEGADGGSYKMVDRGEEEEEADHTGAGKAEEGSIYGEGDDGLSVDHRLHNSVVEVARWAICGLFLCLIPTTVALFFLDTALPLSITQSSDAAPSALSMGSIPLSAIMFFSFLSFSFLGRWTYDLSITQLSQMLIPATHRSSFGGTEMALVSSVSLVHWVAAAVWHEQSDFKWLALGSFCAVGAATITYICWHRWWKARPTNISYDR